MEELKSYVQALLAKNGIEITPKNRHLFDEFTGSEENIQKIKQIFINQTELMQDFRLKNRLHDIESQHVSLPNGMVGKKYEALLDPSALGWSDFAVFRISGLEEIGLEYSKESKLIQGTPHSSGDLRLLMEFRLNGESETEVHEKRIPLVINPDPKSLWKNIASDTSDKFWKEDVASASVALGEKHLVAVSKRGRSHANAGSFRDDDFAYAHLSESGWSVVAVADGAGSAKASRQGSRLAVNGVVDYYRSTFTPELLARFDGILEAYRGDQPAEAQKELNKFLYNYVGGAGHRIHLLLEEFAAGHQMELKDLHTTLIFALFKKYDFGYVILTFGVGDCPIGVLNKEQTEVKLMNRLDVGEYGGGTRFITMPEIFGASDFASRISFKIIDDFSYLFLMTDGIYDPKFVVEANLEKLDHWKTFLHDLKGVNESQEGVHFEASNPEVTQQLSDWMDFWSPGNHDDRTLAVIF